MTYLFLHLIMHYYAFVIVSLTWLAYFLSHDYFSYKFTRFFIYFLFLSDEGPALETLDLLSVLAAHRPFYISICISTLPTQHTTWASVAQSSKRRPPMHYWGHGFEPHIEHLIARGKSSSTHYRKPWVFLRCSGFLPQEELTGWVRINS